MISGTTHIGATLRDMFDISPANLLPSSRDPYYEEIGLMTMQKRRLYRGEGNTRSSKLRKISFLAVKKAN
jgi:hypothetical protein